MKTCDTCERAAFNSGGVWCTEFHEQIKDITVAEDCGMYDHFADPLGETPAMHLVAGTTYDAGSTTPAQVVDFAEMRARMSTSPVVSTDVDAPMRWSSCGVCGQRIGWIVCPTGGWWAHEVHPADGHDARPWDDPPTYQAPDFTLWRAGGDRFIHNDDGVSYRRAERAFDHLPSSAAGNASTPVEAPHGSTTPSAKVTETWNGDAERRLVVQVDIPFYGKPEQSAGSLKTLERLVALHLRGSVVTVLPESQWKGTP